MASLATVDTYSDVLTKAAYKVGETTADTGTQRQSYLKDALQDINNRRRWSWLLTTGTGITLTTSASYTLASDFTEDAMFEVKVTDISGNDTFYYPIFEWQSPAYANASFGTPPVYYIRGNRADGFTITLLPTPRSTDVGKTLNYKYYKNVTDYGSITDKVMMPDSSPLVLGVAKEIFRAQNRLDQYQLTRDEYEIAVAELEKTDIELERALNREMMSYQQFLGVPNDPRAMYDNS